MTTLAWDEVFDCAVAAWCRSSTSQEMLRMCFQSRTQQNEVSVGWTANELMAFATGIARLAAAPTPPAEQQATPKAAPGEPTGKQSLQVQVWVLPNGKGGGQFSWEPQDERFWTKLAPQQEAQKPCQTCAALARTVMCDQVSFDRKPDCYGIRQVTDDEGVEEWEDIRTSPDVAREEARDMMATGRGEIYEVVPLWTTPQPAPAPLSEMPYEKRKAIQEGEQISASDAWFHARLNMLDTLDRRNVFRAGFDRGWNAALAAQKGTP